MEAIKKKEQHVKWIINVNKVSVVSSSSFLRSGINYIKSHSHVTFKKIHKIII